MFRSLKDAANRAAKAVGESANIAGDIKQKAQDLADGLQSRTPTMDDVRSLLGILDYVPGIDKQDLTNELLAGSVGILQFGSMSILITYDGNDFGAEALKLDKIDVEAANTAAGQEKYSRRVISASDDPEKPSIHLITNDGMVADVGADYLTKRLLTNLIVTAIMLPVEAIPLIGKPVAFILEPPCELVVDFLVNRVHAQFQAAEDQELGTESHPQPPAKKPGDFNGPA